MGTSDFDLRESQSTTVDSFMSAVEIHASNMFAILAQHFLGLATTLIVGAAAVLLELNLNLWGEVYFCFILPLGPSFALVMGLLILNVRRALVLRA